MWQQKGLLAPVFQAELTGCDITQHKNATLASLHPQNRYAGKVIVGVLTAPTCLVETRGQQVAGKVPVTKPRPQSAPYLQLQLGCALTISFESAESFIQTGLDPPPQKKQKGDGPVIFEPA